MKKAVSIASVSLLLAAGGTVAFGGSAASAAPSITPKVAKPGNKCSKKGKVKTTAKYGKLKCVKKNGKLKWKKVTKASSYDSSSLFPSIALPSAGSS